MSRGKLEISSSIPNGALSKIKCIASSIVVQLSKSTKFPKRKRKASLDAYSSKKIMISNCSLDTSSSNKNKSSKSNSPNLNNTMNKKNYDLELSTKKKKKPKRILQVRLNQVKLLPISHLDQVHLHPINSGIISTPLQNKSSDKTIISKSAQNIPKLPRTHNSEYSFGSDDSGDIYNSDSKSQGWHLEFLDNLFCLILPSKFYLQF